MYLSTSDHDRRRERPEFPYGGGQGQGVHAKRIEPSGILPSAESSRSGAVLRILVDLVIVLRTRYCLD